jgi:hypothetical protein
MLSKRWITNRLLFNILIYYSIQRRLVSFLTLTSILFIGILLITTTFSNNDEQLAPYRHEEDCQSEAEKNFVSMCSCKADRRGLHQNVIAFSLYGNFSDANHFTRYVDPIRILLANISQVYPG